MPDKPIIIWKPHEGPQTVALTRPEFEVLYGGARGGGKTDAGIMWLTRLIHNPKLRALVVRRNADDLKDWIDRANQIYSQLGATKKGNPPEFHWSSGAVIRTGHLKDVDAYTKYQGHEYQRMLIEELNQIPTERAYLRLISSCRSTVPEIEPRVFLTTNPGGLGHAWVKKRFIDVAPWGKPFEFVEYYNGKRIVRSRIFIHAKLDDNPTLVKNDPGYVLNLEQLKDTDPELYKAWRFGDWDVFAGQVFKEFSRDRHVMPAFRPKYDMSHFIGIDWGYEGRDQDEGAFAGVALVLVKENYNGVPFNRVIVYREWYWKHQTPHDSADTIYDESYVNYTDGVGDSSMFNPQSDGSTPIATLMHQRWDERHKGKVWLRLKKGTKNRIGRVATLHNWLSLAPDGLPYLLFTDNCINLMRTIPSLIYDKFKVEDVDTEGEDHLYDALTYILTAIKFIPAKLGAMASGAKPEKPTKLDTGEPVDLGAFATAKKRATKDWRA